jgi:hypothetical protein
MFTHLTAAQLAERLASVPPASLKALELLRQLQPPPGEWFPACPDAAALTGAAQELSVYLNECQALSKRLGALRPIPTSRPLMEYGL